jgi:hypothetical protein
MKQLRRWVSALVLILIFLNCAKDKPLPTGYSDIFGDKEGQVIDTLIVKQDGMETYYSRLVNTGAGANLLLGSYQHYHSAIYMKFGNLPDSADVHSAKLHLIKSPIDSTLLASNQDFTLDLYHAEFEWENGEDPEQYLGNLPFNSNPFQTVNVTIDTSDKIEIDLDTLVVSDWTDTTSGIMNRGFWMYSEDLQGIFSCYSTENADNALKPRMELIYTFTDTTGKVRDTTTVYATNDAFLIPDTASVMQNLVPDHFYTGKGLAFRSFVKFDLSGYDTTIHVNRALMEIVINKDQMIGNISQAIDIFIFPKAEESRAKGDVEEAPETSSYLGTLNADTLSFDVTTTAQRWVGNDFPNYGFLIRSLDEDATLSRTAFYSSKSGVIEQQPRLYLYYTIPPKQQF